MDPASITAINKKISLYIPCILIALGNIGCICNFITFTSKQLRRNSCAWYFLMSSIADFTFINFGLPNKMANELFGSTLINVNLGYCRLRTFITWAVPCFSTSFIVLAALDRCMSTSQNTRFRSFSQIKIAHRITCVPILLYSATTSHVFVFFDLPFCAPRAGAYSLFISIYSIVWTSLILQAAMLILGLITYYNVRMSRRRLTRATNQQSSQQPSQQRSRVDVQLITIMLFQVLSSSILLNTRTIYYSYSVLSTSIVKDSQRVAIEALLLQLSSFVFYINFCKSFFVNTCTSTLFRNVLYQRVLAFYQRITPWKVRIHPASDMTVEPTRVNQTHMPAYTVQPTKA